MGCIARDVHLPHLLNQFQGWSPPTHQPIAAGDVHLPHFNQLQGMDTDELNQVVSTLDVAKAECLYEKDKKMIIGNIE